MTVTVNAITVMYPYDGIRFISEVKSVTDRGGWASLSEAEKSELTVKRRRRRCFHRVMSGLERGGYHWAMMLSTGLCDREHVQRAWRSLVAWGKKRGLLEDYIRVPERTEAGDFHLHIVYRGKFIERVVLMAKWYQLVGGVEYQPGLKYVYLQGVRRKRGIAAYLSKYMAKIERWDSGNYSWSRWWVWKGFVRDWVAFKRAWAYCRDVLHWDMPYGVMLRQWRCFCAAGQPP